MARTQQRPIAQPGDADKTLGVYTTVLQGNLEQLFGYAHEHMLKTAAPADSDGTVGDITLVEDGSTTKIYVKFKSGWKSATFI